MSLPWWPISFCVVVFVYVSLFLNLSYNILRKTFALHSSKKLCIVHGMSMWPTLCDTSDYCSPPCSVLVIFQARILEWVAISYSRCLRLSLKCLCSSISMLGLLCAPVVLGGLRSWENRRARRALWARVSAPATGLGVQVCLGARVSAQLPRLEHLGCFRVLAIINSAAINIRVYMSFWIRVFSGYMLQEWNCRIVW